MFHSTEELIVEQLQDPLSSFSIGSFGAIAEFQRAPEESATMNLNLPFSIVTDRGSLKIDLIDKVQPIAYENLSKNSLHWRNGIVFCLPIHSAKLQKRGTLTELGPDWSAIRAKDQGASLFDIGINTINVDFCIRTGNEKLIEVLRRAEGRSIFEPDNPVIGEIIAANPHRVAISKLGRIEVYQHIPSDRTPDGPHTHLLPKLVRVGRTHSANVPIPEGYVPCLSCYPPNPLYDSLGNEKSLDNKKLQDFMGILEKWGLPDYLEEKKRVLVAIQQSIDPSDFKPPTSRLGRTALRVTLRQLICQNNKSPLLGEWRRAFDTVDNDSTD